VCHANHSKKRQLNKFVLGVKFGILAAAGVLDRARMHNQKLAILSVLKIAFHVAYALQRHRCGMVPIASVPLSALL
jgi:hypothetical protein